MLRQRFGDIEAKLRRGFLRPFPNLFLSNPGSETRFSHFKRCTSLHRDGYSLKRVAQPLDL